MLHIVLGILKWVGILLLAVLLLLLVLALAVLLVPVRYQGRAVKNKEECSARFRVSWLLHIISLSLSIDARSRQREFTVRIFGIALSDILSFFRKLRGRKKNRALHRSRTDMDGSDEHPEETAPGPGNGGSFSWKEEDLPESHPDGMNPEPEEFSQEDDAETDGIPEEAADREAHDLQEGTDRQSDESADREKDRLQEETASRSTEGMSGEAADGEADSRQEEDVGNGTQDSGTQTDFLLTRLVRWLKALPGKLREVFEKLRGIPGRVRAAFARGRSLVERAVSAVQRLRANAAAIPGKLEGAAAFVEDYELMELLGVGKLELFYLLRHYLPGKLEGFLRFGTDDPALTGKLTGVIYLLLPAKAKFTVEPVFHETVFETEMVLSGHVRAVHLVRTAWHLFRNKKLRRLIRRIRKK